MEEVTDDSVQMIESVHDSMARSRYEFYSLVIQFIDLMKKYGFGERVTDHNPDVDRTI